MKRNALGYNCIYYMLFMRLFNLCSVCLYSLGALGCIYGAGELASGNL